MRYGQRSSSSSGGGGGVYLGREGGRRNGNALSCCGGLWEPKG